MVALKEIWQEQQRQRQQELVQRQQSVSQQLATFQKQRQANALELRQTLHDFQQTLQRDTQAFLSDAQRQRQVQAQELADLLHLFKQTLQAETAQSLAVHAADRSLMAQQVSQDLACFHTHLATSVLALRQTLQMRLHEIQDEVASVRAIAHESVSIYQQERLQMQAQLADDLAAFVDTLQTDVQTYLQELQEQRQMRSHQIQALLHEARMRRAAELDALMEDFAAFRTELQQFCTELRGQVWGQDSRVSEPAALPPHPTPEPVRMGKPKPPLPEAPQIKALQTRSRAKARLNVTRSTSSKTPAIAKTYPLSTTLASAATLPQPNPQQPSTPTAEPLKSLTAVIDTTPPVTATDPRPLPRDAAQLEKAIYTYLHETQGAKLTEIESTLTINRFQAVDALRALIKKGLVIQRDRIYLIQEDISL